MPALNEEASAPYIPFRTFLNQIIRMEDGVPQRLDKSFLVSQSGGLHQPIIAAFRFFGFVDAQGLTTPALHEVATGGDRRDDFLREVFARVYAWADLGPNATQAQLDEAFKDRTGLGGSTLRKAVTFYLHGARHLGFDLSKHYSVPRGTPDGAPAGSRKRAAPKRKPKGADKDGPAVSTAGTSNAHRDTYIALLLTKAESAEGEEAEKLFNRIEKLLGEGGDAVTPK